MVFKNIFIFCRCLLFYIIALISLIIFCIFLILFLFCSKKYFSEYVKLFAQYLLKLSSIFLGIKYKVEGNIYQKTCIFAPQHQSTWDSVIMFAYLPASSFVCKSELRRNIILLIIIWKLNFIVVNNKKRNLKQFNKILKKTKEILRSRRNVVIYPEGERIMFRKKLRKGVAFLHKYLNVNVVPIKMATGYCWPRSFLKFPGVISVKFYHPIKKCNPYVLLKKLEEIYYD